MSLSIRRPSFIHACVAGLILGALAAPPGYAPAAAAETPPRPGPAASTIVEAVGSELVLVDLWAVDKGGHPVTDLRADEVVLLVDGRRHAIEALEPGGRRGPAGAPSVAAPAGTLTVDTTPAAGPERHDGPVRYLLFFNDALSTGEHMGNARRHAERFVTEGGRPGDLLAIAMHTENDRLRIVQEWSADRSEVLRTLRASLADPRRVSDLMNELTKERGTVGSLKRTQLSEKRTVAEIERNQVVDEGRSTRQAMRLAIDLLGSWPGRKAMVYFGDGLMGIQPLDVEGMIESASAAAVTIHAVDTWGDIPSMEFQQRLVALARGTGGVSHGSNDLSVALGEIDAAEASAYVLSFAPSGPPDGRPHALRITCTRPGVTLRHRQEFVRLPPEEARARALQAAYVAPEMQRSFGLDALLGGPDGAGGGASADRDLVLYLPAGRLLFLPGPDGASALFEVGLVARDAGGRELRRLSRRVQVAGGRDRPAEGEAAINLRYHAAVPAGAADVTAVVADVRTGRIGAARLELRNDDAAGRIVGLSLRAPAERSLWVDLEPDSTAAAEAAAHHRGSVPGPAVRTTFHVSETPVCEFRLVQGAPGRSDLAGLRLAVRDRDGVVQVQPVGDDEVVARDRDGVTLRAPLPLASLGRGDFVLAVEQVVEGEPVTLGRLPLRVEAPR